MKIVNCIHKSSKKINLIVHIKYDIITNHEIYLIFYTTNMTDKIDITDKNIATKVQENNVPEILTNVEYICKSTKLISESLRNGCDIAQLPNGDVMVTETKIVHMHYVWSKEKNKMVRLS